MSNTKAAQKQGSRYFGLNVGGYILDELIASSEETNSLMLGNGRKSSVYKVHKSAIPDIPLVMKIYLPEISQNATFRGGITEFNILKVMQTKKFDKSHIVEMIDAGFIDNIDPNLDGSAYVVMEYMNKGSFWENYQEQTLEEKIHVFLDIAQGLAAAHSLQPPIAHGDVHPGNILLDSEKGVKLSDFGLSAIIESAHGFILRSSRKGAVRYRDPVMDQERAITPKNDIYQLGMSMFEILSGISTFDSDIKDDFLGGYPTIPLELKHLMLQCTGKKRPTINDVVERLQGVIIPTMSPEYKRAVSDVVNTLERITSKYDRDYRTLSDIQVDQLFNTIREKYNEMKRRGFNTPVEEVEMLKRDAMERDLQIMSEFLVKHHPKYRNIEIPKKMVGAPTFYKKAIQHWESYLNRDISFEDGIHVIEQR